MQYLPLDVYNLDISEYLASPYDDFNYKTILRRGTDIPTKILIPKDRQRTKFRAVYNYPKETKGFFRVLNKYFSRHYVFNDNTFAYRKGIPISVPINEALRLKNQGYYILKVDISSYFNSVKYDYLSEVILPRLFADGKSLDLMRTIFSNRECYLEDQVTQEDMGIQPGNPFSSFLANYILDLLDRYMIAQTKGYVRYSDDILIAGKSKDELQKYLSILKAKLDEIGLSVNPNKVEITSPQQPTTFLGVIIFNGIKYATKNRKTQFKRLVKHYTKKYRGKDFKMLPFEEKVSRCFTELANNLFGAIIYSDKCCGIGGFLVNNCTSEEDDKELNDYLVQEFKVLKTDKHNKTTWYKTTLRELQTYGFIDWFTMKRYFKTNKYFFAERLYNMHRNLVLNKSQYNLGTLNKHVHEVKKELHFNDGVNTFVTKKIITNPIELYEFLLSVSKQKNILSQIYCNPLKGDLSVNNKLIYSDHVYLGNTSFNVYLKNSYYRQYIVRVTLKYCVPALYQGFNYNENDGLNYDTLFKLYTGYCLNKSHNVHILHKPIRATMDCEYIDSNLQDETRVLMFNLYLFRYYKSLLKPNLHGTKYIVVANPQDKSQYFILMS